MNDVEAIHARSRSCLDAMNRGDIDAVMDHYTDDAMLMFSGVPLVKGADAIRRHWESVDQADREAKLETLEITVEGDTAYEVALFEVVSVDDEGLEHQTSGKNVVVWRRGDDGRWRLNVDICATDF